MLKGLRGKIFVLVALSAMAFFVTRLNDSTRDGFANTSPTKTITITKYWNDGNNTDNKRPDTITAYIKWQGSTLLPGCQASGTNCPAGVDNSLENKMKLLSGSGGVNTDNTTITAIKKATNEQYEAIKSSLTTENEIQASGEKTYMWFDGATGTIYFYSEASQIYLNASSAGLFRRMKNLTDISGLAYFNTSHVTDMNRMFQDSGALVNLSPIANWYTSGVTNMGFMFGGNTSGSTTCTTEMSFTNASNSLPMIANWDVKNVTDMNQMFKCNKSLTDVNFLSGWDVSSLYEARQIFNQSGVTDASGVKNWDVSRVKGDSSTSSDSDNGFYKWFFGAPVDADLTGQVNWFTNRAGEWIKKTTGDNATYYSPTAGPTAAPTPSPSITPAVEAQQTCTTWVKSGNVWTCTITVSNDGADYIAWEDKVKNYDEIDSAYADNPKVVASNQVSFTNKYDPKIYHDITLQKTTSGDLANANDVFTFSAKAYDENGAEDATYAKSLSLKSGGSVAVFSIPDGYSYTISEDASSYAASYVVNKTDDSSIITSGSGLSTASITPKEDQTVIFTNSKTSSPARTMTITKSWIDDSSVWSVVRPNDITVTVKKTVSELPTGASLKSTMTSLAGSINNIHKFLAGDCATRPGSATNIASGGEPTYMWYSGNVIYICSEADNIYANADMELIFQNFANLSDIGGLALLNTAYVTNMAGMFQNSTQVGDLSPLANWDVSNVTSMRYMFANSSNTAMAYSDLSPLKNWNTQKVTDMNGMFRSSFNVNDLTPLAGWNVQNVADMQQMFNRVGLNKTPRADLKVLEGWQPVRVGQTYYNEIGNTNVATGGSFSQVFANSGRTAAEMPNWVARPGTWSSAGTLTPSSGPATGLAPANTKTPDATNQFTCTGVTTTGENGKWTKDNTNNKWTCTLSASNDESIWRAWESTVAGYTGSNTSEATAVAITGGAATITNALQKYIITVKKFVTGNMADLTKPFDMTIEAYTGNTASTKVDGYISDANQPSLKHGGSATFIVPSGWSYQVSERNDNATSDYTKSVKITKTGDGVLVSTPNAGGHYTGIITPVEDQTVTFTNNFERAPITGVFDRKDPFNIVAAITAGTGLTLLIFYHLKKTRIRDG